MHLPGNRQLIPGPFQFLENELEAVRPGPDFSGGEGPEFTSGPGPDFGPDPLLEVRLSEREELVLNALIHTFVQQGKPVGSRFISQAFPLQLSPASIRNVMADLEGKGYLQAPHKSAGRIPTVQAYRYYVDNLLDLSTISLEDKKRIQEEYLRHELKLDSILKVTVRVLSMISSYASIVLGPHEDLSILKHIELISVTPQEILVILVTRSGMVFNKTVIAENPVGQEDLYKISRFLNENLKGYDIADIREDILPRLMRQRSGIEAFPMVMQGFLSVFGGGENQDADLYLGGYENISAMFDKVEEKSQEALVRQYNDQVLLREVCSRSVDTEGVNAIILDEDNHLLPGLSIVTTHYRMGEKKIGSMGVIGPNRMDYARVMPLVTYVGGIVSELVTKISR